MSNLAVASLIISLYGDEKSSFQDKNNIVWKMIDGKLQGKRSVWTKDYRSCWLEETEIENIESWWCGIDADYDEVFNS